ncbi:hypothetical protein GOV12_03735 [Candidatus Pacearchaeota archaeon]|nr:hypothetical protein [Candidatus Pacearchaeota archaeon]
MKTIYKNILTVVIILLVTALVMLILSLIPGYLRGVDEYDIMFTQPLFIFIFIIVDLILIGIPFGIHYIYVKDYSKLKNLIFFAIFGGVVGYFLGEYSRGTHFLVIISYTILMFIYALFYKKFIWWKVALTTYLGGVLIESGINRSPLQVPSLLWVAFFTYPYFVTKIIENRKKISFKKMFLDFKWTVFFAVFLGLLGIIFNLGMLIFVFLTFPFIINIIYLIFGGEKRKKVSMIQTLINLKYTIITSVVLIILAIFITQANISPPLIVFGAILPFIVRFVYRLIFKKSGKKLNKKK